MPTIILRVKAGILGLSGVGKSTLFQLLTGSAASVSGRPEARLGIARVPDARLEKLTEMFHPKKKTPATVEYVDVPGVSKGQGGVLVDLPALRGVDVLVHVVRAFESDVVPHPEGSLDPVRDVDLLELEMKLADLQTVERKLERLEKSLKKLRNAEELAELALFERLKRVLETDRPLREHDFDDADQKRLRSYAFLSGKPLLVAVNLGEEQLRDSDRYLEGSGLVEVGDRSHVELCVVSAPIEAEMAQLDGDDARAFRDELGLAEPGLDRVIRSSYGLLGLISFFTVGEDECRAWTIRDGTAAQRAAATIHSDIERGFIRAEVVRCEDLVEAGSLAACRERGTLRLEGKEYGVQDGDVVHFRFNV